MNAPRSIVDPEGAGWLRNFSARPNSHGQLGQLTITSPRANPSLTSPPPLIPTLRRAANFWGAIYPRQANHKPQNFQAVLAGVSPQVTPRTPIMAMRNPQLRSLPSRLFQTITISRQCIRPLSRKAAPSVPTPTPFVPDVQTFLTLIGREMSKHASKISSWEQLFSSNSDQLRQLGIENARQRRYLMRKREKFRNGVYGPGGDLEQVVDGVAQLRVVEVPHESGAADSAAAGASSATLTPGMKKAIVNLAPDATEYKHSVSAVLKKFAHMKIHRGSKIMGPFLQPIKGSHGSAATISVQEGMWEDRRGQKVDGGERRRVEVRAKKRLEERRKA
ncbi:hypothetical protein PMG11_06232 [Penicillium brasilianum]|uniref:Small ribosomal subunit protein mS41 n=1 Tax=Penicillium brasilianum TaxID=104259 RepID=A0A0F7TRC1_PENBI|nr:hypothetical protein PMG11_06232 [Penicillium brasilianum]